MDVTGKTISMIAPASRWAKFLMAVLALSALPSASTTSTSQPFSRATSFAPLMKRALLDSLAEMDTIPNRNSSSPLWDSPPPQAPAATDMNASSTRTDTVTLRFTSTLLLQPSFDPLFPKPSFLFSSIIYLVSFLSFHDDSFSLHVSGSHFSGGAVDPRTTNSGSSSSLSISSSGSSILLKSSFMALTPSS